MKHHGPAKNATPRQALIQLAAAKATGSIQINGFPGGVIYLVDGAVDYVESPAAVGVERLLIGSQRVDPDTWQAAVDARGPDRYVGATLVERGHLTAGEVELCTLGAIHDAAYFVLTSEPAEVRFEAGARHWWGAAAAGPGLSAEDLLDRIEPQRRILDAAHPSAVTDLAPVVPIRRVTADRVLLSGLQWEILLHADGSRTPCELAHLLARSGYAVVLETRRLAAAGLLALPAPVDPPRHAPDEVVREVPAPPRRQVTRRAEVFGEETAEIECFPPPLPRRTAGAFVFDDDQDEFSAERRRVSTLAINSLAGMAGSPSTAPDDTLLQRIRSALQSLR